ncbi:MAG: oligosaccharide flippase family protein, partial [Ignavibacteria bacterium]
MSRLIRIFSDNKHLILSGLAERLFFFFIFLIIARQYATNQYGEIITVFSLANIFIIFFDFGLPALLQKEVSLSGRKASGFLSNVMLISITFFPIYILSVYFYCLVFYESIPSELIIIIALTVYFFSLGNIFSKALSGLGLFKNIFFSLLVSRIYILIFVVLALLIYSPGLNEIFLITLSGSAVQIAILYNFTKKNNLISFTGFFDFKKSYSLLKFASPLGLAV